MQRIFRGSLFVTAILAAAPLVAQDLAPEALVQQLAPGQAGPMVTALRDQGALNFPPTMQFSATLDFAAADVPVAFDGETFLLSADGMRALRSVAAALNDPNLADAKFQVAAHMFSEKDPNSVQRISTRRAQIVAEHLIAFYNIPPERLVPVGYGAAAPVNAASPYDPTNTRIQFINISGL